MVVWVLFVAVGLFGYRLTDDRVLISFLPAFLLFWCWLLACCCLFSMTLMFGVDVWIGG